MLVRRDKVFFRVFFLPAFLLLLSFSVYAIIGVLGLSFTSFNLQRPHDWNFTAGNYPELVRTGRFWNSVGVSFYWSLLTTSSSMVIGTTVALFMFRRFSKQVEHAATILFILPFLLSKVGVAQIWKLLYRPFDLLNYGLSLVNVAPIRFLSDPAIVLVSIVAVDAWQWSFLIAFLILTLLNGIPDNFIEEADVLGVPTLTLHLKLTLPMIKTGFLSIFFLKIVESLRSFDLIYNLTRGGPGVRTETFDLYAYYRGIVVSGRIGSAAAMSIVMLLITIVTLTALWSRTKEKSIEL